MDREEKMSKMYNYCDGKHCSNCKVDKENPNHECGNGKGYSMDYNMVSNEELDMNYKIAFEEVKEDEKVDKFKVGDKVRIIARKSEHCFKVGEKVKLYELWDNEDVGNGVAFLAQRINGKLSKQNIVRTKDLKLDESSKTFTITVSDSSTTLTSDDKTVEIKRYNTDKHDVKVAVNEVVKKYFDEVEMEEKKRNMPKIGDKVRVIDNNKTYDTFSRWLINNNVKLESAIKWQNHDIPKQNKVYEVTMIVGSHVLIEDPTTAFIIGIDGLEVIK